ncbi:hypothetical protein HEK616_31270 [Streptomyces nigrescens]|uniref:HTH cro/C1-type domain-containing protein n=1 Tax=Streptomyces nigrescens TaxID=1920 RepID=A0ABN6QUG3_STRNI|nr:XRE family transcriptional regulator [Streptomyces nigrescens]BDM69640.1 hypothetical protein HEK616_31270 [Streptomyces nigrescens]
MTDWKSLPDGLASDVRHLVVELRALKERTGLSLTALARRTPHSKSSWERYLNGKALPSQHAVTSLGKLADADPARLLALWELANTAWHDREVHDVREAHDDSEAHDDREAHGVHETHDDTEARDIGEVRDRQPGAPTPGTEPTPAPPAAEPPARRRLSRRPPVWALIALAVVVASSAALFMAFGRHSTAHTDRDGTPGANASTRQLDVNCFADSCAGKDPKQTGCGGDAWTAALDKVAGVYVELRYSDACKAAWSRISWGRRGDIARVVGAGGRTYQNKVHYDTDTFSAMVAAPSPSTARACVQLTSGVHACTSPGGTQHLTEPPNPPTASPSANTPSAATPKQGQHRNT